MGKIISIIFLCLLPLASYGISDSEAFRMLSQKSQQIKSFPFKVDNSQTFQGLALPASSYKYFSTEYGWFKANSDPDQLFATYKFSKGKRWQFFLLRGPGQYLDINQIDLWIFDTNKNRWHKPLTVAESWGDAGYSVDVRSWIVLINKNNTFYIIRRTFWEDMGLQSQIPNTTNGIKDELFVWEKDQLRKKNTNFLSKEKIEAVTSNKKNSK